MKSSHGISVKLIIALFILFSSVLINSCQKREYDNPYDEHVLASAWAPYDLQISDISITEKKLEWKCDASNVENFIIDRKAGNSEWQLNYRIIPAGTFETTDNDIIPSSDITYQYRIYATAGTRHSAPAEISINFACPSPFKDPRNGKSYKAVQIGTQCWMAGNLNYQTGNSWCYDNNSSYCDIYGRLYDWATLMNGASSSNAVPSGVQGICPDGWHVPSDAEWTILVDYLSGDGIAGGAMKEAGYTHWNRPNTGATNSSGFSTLPGGYRSIYGSFYYMGSSAYFGSSSEYDASYAWGRILYYDFDDVSRSYYYKDYGRSVRCLRDF